MKVIPVEEAEGTVLCHDITEIVPGQFKGRAFKKGHVVAKADIQKLLRLGKESLYVWELGTGFLHENDAATRIARAGAGFGISLTEPVEGKISLKAEVSGLLKINSCALEEINSIDQILFVTLHSNQIVKAGQKLASCGVVPLVIGESKIADVEAICTSRAPIVTIKPLMSRNVGIVTTGGEVYAGRIKDQFGPVIRRKVADLGSRTLDQTIVPDDIKLIANAIRDQINRGAELVIATGGMSVDPNDVTPSAIRAAGGEVLVYGAPVLPGAMFLLAKIGDVPILGVPGCVMYNKTTVLDLILPRILAGETITRHSIVRLGHGGLCLNCESCRFPNCSFGKGLS
jgi:molybdenum cofactor synthesis domain-containing protein